MPNLLREFRHPLILTSIGLLLVNDHLLKYLFPSALSGKLSDFAGLFFFPFLLGVILQYALRLNARRALFVGIVFTGLLFSAVKLLPGVNASAQQMLEHLLGLPVHIVLDPTDLLALLVFLPAWGLRARIENEATLSQPPGRLAYAALAAGSLAALATSCNLAPSVTRIHLQDGVLYIRTDNDIMASSDGGLTWQVKTKIGYGNDIPAVGAFSKPVQFPLVACNSIDPSNCYRITGTDVVEESNDAGETWKMVWHLPPERIDYMFRAADLPCGFPPDTSFYDLTFGTVNEEPVLYLAMGNQGIVRHTPGGSWERMSVGTEYNPAYGPTPFWARNIGEAVRSTLLELTYTSIIGASIWLGLSRWCNQGRKISKVRYVWVVMIAIILVILALILFLFHILSRFPNFLALSSFFVPGLFLVMFTHMLYLSNTLREQPPQARRNYWLAFLSTLAIAAFPYSFFLIWAFGWIPYYTTALVLSVLSGLALIAAAIFNMRSRIGLLSEVNING